MDCKLRAAAFKALVEAAWPALASFRACMADVEFSGPRALGAAAFAGFSALEAPDLALAPPTLEDAQRWAPALVELKI
jgi:hypothetical protein